MTKTACFRLGLFGWDAGVIGGIVANSAFLKFINFTGDAPMLTFCVAGILLGDVVGCLLAIPFVYRIGRRLCIICACVSVPSHPPSVRLLTGSSRQWISLVGVILQTSTFSAIEMIIGRILLGLGNGAISGLFVKPCQFEPRSDMMIQPLYLLSFRNPQWKQRRADLRIS